MKTPYALEIYTPRGLAKGAVLPGKKILHVGCGGSKLVGATGIDRLKLPPVDVVHDLDRTPWPFADGSFDIVYAHSVVEHVGDLVKFFDECWRVLKPGGRIILAVPYFRSVDAFTDPTHTHFFTSRSLDYFLTNKSGLSDYRYSEHVFTRVAFWYGWPGISPNPLVRAFKSFIYKRSKFYDQYLSLLWPMKILVWELEK